MTLDEAHRLALKILKEVMEEKVDENNIQLAQVSTPGAMVAVFSNSGRGTCY